MDDEQIFDYLNDVFKNSYFVELRYSSFNECFILQGPKHDGYGESIQQAAEDYKKKVEDE